MNPPGTITAVVNAVANGAASPELQGSIERLYTELRALAGSKLAGESLKVLSTTDLVHEAYLKLFRAPPSLWENRAHFFGSAARAMEQVLIDLARRRDTFGGSVELGDRPATDVLDAREISQAITTLERVDPELGHLVRLKVFAGLSIAVLSEVMCISERTASRRWTFARAWLFQELTRQKSACPERGSARGAT